MVQQIVTRGAGSSHRGVRQWPVEIGRAGRPGWRRQIRNDHLRSTAVNAIHHRVRHQTNWGHPRWRGAGQGSPALPASGQRRHNGARTLRSEPREGHEQDHDEVVRRGNSPPVRFHAITIERGFRCGVICIRKEDGRDERRRQRLTQQIASDRQIILM